MALAGCGAAPPRSTAPRPTPADQRLSAQDGRLVVRGDYAPAERGPLELHGRYRVTFRQRGAGVDFRREVPFTAHLEQARAGGAPARVALFQRAAASGVSTVRAEGRWTLAVDFGDSPFEIVLTPAG